LAQDLGHARVDTCSLRKQIGTYQQVMHCGILACFLLSNAAELQVGRQEPQLVTHEVSSNGEVHKQPVTAHHDKLQTLAAMPEERPLGGAGRTMRSAQSLHEVSEKSLVPGLSSLSQGDTADNCIEFFGQLETPGGDVTVLPAESWDACLQICSKNSKCQQVQWVESSKNKSCSMYKSWIAHEALAGLARGVTYQAALCNPPDDEAQKLQERMLHKVAQPVDGQVKVISGASHHDEEVDAASESVRPFSRRNRSAKDGMLDSKDRWRWNIFHQGSGFMREFFTFPTWAVFMGCVAWVTSTVYLCIWLQIVSTEEDDKPNGKQ